MTGRQKFMLTYVLLVAAQMVICNYFHLSPFITLSILPAMILCIPLSVKTPTAMLIAFATGLAVDLLSDSVIGLNAFALVPVALLRINIIRLVLGADIINRGDDISFAKNGYIRVSLAALLVTFVYFIFYTAADIIGARPFWFIACRIAASSLASSLVSLIAVNLLTSSSGK